MWSVLAIMCLPPADAMATGAARPLPGVELVWQHSFTHPVHCVWYGDLTHDGLSELAVVSMAGVHILQVRPGCVRSHVTLLVCCSTISSKPARWCYSGSQNNNQPQANNNHHIM